MVSWASFDNVIGIDPQLIDPENGDFRVTPGSPAEGYGCQVFPDNVIINSILKPQIEIKYKRHTKRSSIEVFGSIDENTTWQADTVKVIGDLNIENDIVLTVLPGTRVEFQGFYSLNVNGCIRALGEPDQRILFTSAHPELFEPDSTTSGAWNGIRFHTVSALNQKSIFKYCNFEYSKILGDTIKGGAISFYNYSKARIENCTFTLNVAEYGGALGFDYQSSPEIFGCLFIKNYALSGGSPIYCAYSYPHLTNNTIIDNYVFNKDINYRTAALQTFISKPLVTNNIIRDNITHYFDPGQLVECKDFYTEYNNIEFGHGGEGNIDEDPFFHYSGEYPYSLLQFSPCINAGAPDTIGLNIPLFDLAGQNRIYNSRVDMGAYEWQGFGVDIQQHTELLISAYPNPFTNSTCITFNNTTRVLNQLVNSLWQAEIKIYNVKGQLVRKLGFRDLDVAYSIVWDGKDEHGRDVCDGAYFITSVISNQSMFHKVLKIN